MDVMFHEEAVNVMDVREVQYENAWLPMDVTPVPMITDWREVHDMNASRSISVTELGITRDAGAVAVNAWTPMAVTVPRLTDARAVQLQKHRLPILVTPDWTTNDVMLYL